MDMDNNLFGEPDPQQYDAPQETTDIAVEKAENADRLIISTPRDNPCLIGHEAVIEQLLDWHDRNALPHALIFTGPRGIGKATAAYALARTLLKDNESGIESDDATDSLFGSEDVSESGEAAPAAQRKLLMDAQDPVFRKIAAQSHPDCLDIAREYDEKKQKPKTALDVHQIRRIQEFLHMRASTPGGRKIAIIDEGETMNRNAQNALLKILEEPPGNSLLIIVADQLGALLATIRSRVRVVHFQPLADQDMRQLLHANSQIEARGDLELIVRIAEGAAGPALELGSEEGREIIHGVLAIMRDWPEVSWQDIYQLSNKIAGKKDSEQGLRIFSYVMTWLTRHMMRIKARGIQPVSCLQGSRFEQALASTNLDQLLKICDNLKHHFDSADHAHLDKHYIVEGAFAILTNHTRDAA
jgi:DNA polymerase-3 subunit delta'